LLNSSVKVKTPFEIGELKGTNGRLDHVVLKEVTAEKEETVSVDSLIVNYGFVSSLGSIKNWGLEIEKNAIVVNSKMETSIKGIYAAGDVATYEGKVKLIATGFGEAPTAVNNAKTYIDPRAQTQPIHSTSLMDKSEKKKVEML
jgi:thioredoxin reductase